MVLVLLRVAGCFVVVSLNRMELFVLLNCHVLKPRGERTVDSLHNAFYMRLLGGRV